MYQQLIEYVKTGKFPEFHNNEEYRKFCEFSTVNMITGAGDSVRERISIELIHGNHIDEKHGWDGKKGNLFIEVKNETLQQKSGLSAKGIFNNLTWRSFNKYSKDNGIYLSAGYSRDGILLYALAFEMKDIIHHLEKALKENIGDVDVNNKNTTVSLNIRHFPERFEVIYLPENINTKNYSSLLLKRLIDNKFNKTKLFKIPLTRKKYVKKRV